jgi:hypothetical protein
MADILSRAQRLAAHAVLVSVLKTEERSVRYLLAMRVFEACDFWDIS